MTLTLGQLRVQINWLVLLCLCSSLGMFISLGFWQLDRAGEKSLLAETYQLRSQSQPLPLLQAERTDSFGNLSRVQTAGTFDNDIPFLLTFQFYQGQAGFEVVTPFRSDDGPLLLVSRGWLAPGPGGTVPAIPPVPGHQQIQAQVHIPDVDIPPATVSDTSWPVRLSRLNIAQAERLLGEPVYPYLLRLESGQPGALARHWQPPSITIRTHIAYAVQWFAIALAVLLAAFLYASNVLSLIKNRQHNRGT